MTEAWDKYATCPDCGAIYRAPFGSLFHLHFEVCPACGKEKNRWVGRFNLSDWPIKTMRWVSTASLLKPSTWGTGYWEEKQP